MHPRVLRQFRVEGCGQRSSLPDGDRNIIFAFGGDDFDGISYALDFGGADEDHFEWRWFFIERALHEPTFADGAVDLASVGVAADADVECAQAELFGILYFGRKQDCAGAGAEGGFGVDEVFELFESFFSQQLQERAGFSAGDDEAVDGVELLGLFDQDDFGTELFEAAAVRVEIALQGQDSDDRTGWEHADSILPEWCWRPGWAASLR